MKLCGNQLPDIPGRGGGEKFRDPVPDTVYEKTEKTSNSSLAAESFHGHKAVQRKYLEAGNFHHVPRCFPFLYWLLLPPPGEVLQTLLSLPAASFYPAFFTVFRHSPDSSLLFGSKSQSQFWLCPDKSGSGLGDASQKGPADPQASWYLARCVTQCPGFGVSEQHGASCGLTPCLPEYSTKIHLWEMREPRKTN